MFSHQLTASIHKLTSCSGCQLAFLNQGGNLLELLKLVKFTHFIEAGLYDPQAPVDVGFIEGSVTTPDDLERLKEVRAGAKWLVSIGACATSGGVQALRNMANGDAWKQAIYAHPEFIETLDSSTPVAEHVKVDFELWGCPITENQITHLIKQLALGSFPKSDAEKLCMDCKRKQHVCTLVTTEQPCLGPVVRVGCGALCPEFGKACFGCFGPSEQPNSHSLATRFAGLGLMPREVANRFASIHSHCDTNKDQIAHWKAIDIREIE